MADPELRDLAAEIEALARREGVDLEALGDFDGDFYAAGIEAAANCMLDGLD